MSHAYRYVTLMCSLPAYESLFSARQTPISRIQLDRRLQMLEPQERSDIELLSQILDWSRQKPGVSDAAYAARVDKDLPKIRNSGVRELVQWRLQLRSIVAALRLKQRKRRLPPVLKRHLGGVAQTVQNHWNEPLLGLATIFPWVANVRRLLHAGSTLELEKTLLAEVWRQLDRKGFGHEFDLEAVAVYRMRWDLVARWSHYNGEAGVRRFSELVSAMMAEALPADTGASRDKQSYTVQPTTSAQ